MSTGDVASLFVEFADEEEAALIRADLADVGPEELAGRLRERCQVLEGLVVMSEGMGPPTYTLLSDARRRAWEALRRADAAAGE